MKRHLLRSAADLDRGVIEELADGTGQVVLTEELVAALTANRRAVLADLDGDQPVYGVNTGMGAEAGTRLSPEARAHHQNTLMTGRAVGSAPWLSRVEARAVLAVRLRTLLHPAAGVSPALCRHLISLLDNDVVPAIPARGGGAAGEIIPLAHVGAVLLGTGEVLGSAANVLPAYSFGAKEGVAFLEGVPGQTGLAVLAGRAVRRLVTQVVVTAAAAHDVIRASPDPMHPALADSDELAAVLAALRDLRDAGPPAAGWPASAAALQAPVSFRVTASAVAVVMRAVDALDAAADRALTGITDSPAHLDGRFVGTAGFAGTDLTATMGALTTALIHLAEVGAARLHRLLDPAVTGLPRQLSDSPGRHAGMVAVHKRAAGVVHRLRRFAVPALLGAIETSLGQEDVQSFGFEAAECLGEAIAGLRDVTACELLAIDQARRLGRSPRGPGCVGARERHHQAGRPQRLSMEAALEEIAVPSSGTGDRPFGRDLDRIIALLGDGWPASAPAAMARWSTRAR